MLCISVCTVFVGLTKHESLGETNFKLALNVDSTVCPLDSNLHKILPLLLI